ncbi:MAG: hypothetical protein HY916_08135 [Desulfovibrio sp.]|nr:hypothetical protein [Desulfovibrio sp.]
MSAGTKSLSAADIARRIQRMTLLVRGEANSLMHLRPASGQGLKPQPGKRSGTGAASGGRRPSPYTGKDYGSPQPDPRVGLQQESHAAGAHPEFGAQGGGWWVLAQGRALDPDDFEAREAARDELLEAVRLAGVLVPENIWVWDETCRAQLVLATLPTEERARRVAERLRQKGLDVAVRPEMPA